MKYALVTGATSGIGLATAEALLEDGCFVFMNYAHNELRAEDVRSKLSAYSERMMFVKTDLSEYAGIEDIISAIDELGAKLTYLVLNFGLTDRTPFGEVQVESWEAVMRANVNVPFFLVQKLFSSKLFAESASVLCLSSFMARMPHSVSVSYGVSKSALSALSLNLVKFLSPLGIRINSVEPGFVDTPWQKEKSTEQRMRIEAKTTIGRFAEPCEIADICLATLKNLYMTGAVIPISGGYGLV